ncbi:MAG TPA: isocitrate/isopropylmalate family dehydrogenase, partial [Usitatibacter sp.]
MSKQEKNRGQTLNQEKATPGSVPTHRIAVIAGDGIGMEVVPEGQRVLEAAGRKFGFALRWDEKPWSCEYYAKHGRMMPEDGLEQIRGHDAIFLGAVGFPGVPDHVSLWGLLIPIRREFQQYVNLRPVRLMPGVASPLAHRKPGDIDFWVVRENNEGEYSNAGGRMYAGSEHEFATQLSVFSRRGCDRIMRFAFELAKTRAKKHVTSATKSNGISITMPYWDERFKAISAGYPGIRTSQYHIDILTAHFVLHPDWFDVVVGSNLFGDILSDLGPACTGTIGIAPSANLNPEREFPSCFEPVHAGPRSERMSPKRLEPTTTSNQSGCWTKFAVRMSMWNLSVFTSGYSAEIALKRSSQYGIVIEMPLDFVADV